MFQYLQKPGSARFDPTDHSLPAPALKFLSLILLHQIPQFSEKKKDFQIINQRKRPAATDLLEQHPAPSVRKGHPLGHFSGVTLTWI